MDHILLLIKDESTRNLLSEILQGSYSLSKPKYTSRGLQQEFDLAIIDRMILDRLQKQIQRRKNEDAPAFLPFLLVASRQDVNTTYPYLWKTIDEIIFLPIEKIELQARVRALILARQQSLKLIQKTHSWYRELAEVSPYYICRYRDDGTLLYVNKTLAEARGLEKNQLVGIRFHDYLPPESQKTFAGMLSKLKKGISPILLEHTTMAKDGTLRWERWFNFPTIPDEEGHSTFLAVGIDITKEKCLEEALRKSKERFHVALKNCPITVFNQDRDLRYTWIYNPHFGFKADEVLGKTDADLLSPEDAAHLTEIKRRVIETGIAAHEEVRVTINGRLFYYDLTIEPMSDLSGNIIGIICAAIDITKYKFMEKDLRENEEKFRNLYMNSTVGIYRTTPEGRILLANPALVEMLGYDSFEELASRNLEKEGYAPSYERSRFIELIEKNGVIRGLETAWVKKDGSIIYIRESARAIRNAEGETLYYDGVIEDITERKRMEEALRQSELRNRVIAEMISDYAYIFQVTPDGELKGEWLSESFTKVFGLTKSEIDATGGWQSVVYSKDLPIALQHAQKIASGQSDVCEFRFMTKDGEIRWLRDYAKPMFDETGKRVIRIFGASQDITEHKRIEEAIHNSEERFRSVFEYTGTATLIVDRVGKIVTANEACQRLFGYKPEKLIGTRWMEYVIPEEISTLQQYFQQRFTNPKQILDRYETRLIDAENKVRDCLVSIGLMPSRDQVIISLWDITERVKAEQERRLLTTAIEHAEEAVFIMDSDKKIIFVNPVFEKMYGYSQEEVLGKTPEFLGSHRQGQPLIKEIREIITAGKVWRGFIFNRKKDGSEIEVHATITPIFDKRGNLTHYVSIHRDMTHERDIERRSQQSQRLEAIGTLAGGIAHDFNNILTPILGYTDLCLMAVKSDSQLYGNLQNIRLAAERAKELVQQILSFSRKTNQERKPIQIVPIVKEALKLLRATIPTTIEIKQNIEPVDLSVVCDPTEIHQIIMNLCTNAYQAMSGSGILTVSLKAVEVDNQFCETHYGLFPGTYIQLTVRDTGSGIPPEILDKIFEPYFTTRGNSGGTGLGLAMVHGIVTSLGGAITVYSEPGEGTEFNLYFPTVSQKLVEVKTSEEKIEGGRENILLVDDEQAIANMGAIILGDYGYKVISVTNPEEALARLQEEPSAFDLLITDMTMPGMTGDQLAQEVLKLRPDIPIVLCTGFNERMDAKKARKIGIARYIHKPFSPNQLAKTVRELLDRREGSGKE